jgi:hypothetical protein
MERNPGSDDIFRDLNSLFWQPRKISQHQRSYNERLCTCVEKIKKNIFLVHCFRFVFCVHWYRFVNLYNGIVSTFILFQYRISYNAWLNLNVSSLCIQSSLSYCLCLTWRWLCIRICVVIDSWTGKCACFIALVTIIKLAILPIWLA